MKYRLTDIHKPNSYWIMIIRKEFKIPKYWCIFKRFDNKKETWSVELDCSRCEYRGASPEETFKKLCKKYAKYNGIITVTEIKEAV